MSEERPASDKKLADEILADARARAEKILKRARRDADRISARAEKAKQKEADRIIEHFRQRAESQQKMVMASVDIEIAKKRLALKEEEIQSVIDEARKKLLEKKSYDYVKVLVNLASQAIRKMQGNDFTIRLAAADESLATDDLLNQIKAAVRDRDVNLKYDAAPAGVSSGVAVLSGDGRQLYDNSFEARLRRLQNQIRKKVAEKIFEETENSDE